MNHEGVEKFQGEINRIQNEDVKVFINNAIVDAPESFWEDQQLVDYTKRVFKVVEGMLDADNVEGMVRDIILTGVLLSDVSLNELSGDVKVLHPMMAKTHLKPAAGDLNPQLFDGICRIIEGHEGSDSPSKALEPKPGSPEHLVMIAHRLVQLDCVTIKL
jgi:hypothetical protein